MAMTVEIGIGRSGEITKAALAAFYRSVIGLSAQRVDEIIDTAHDRLTSWVLVPSKDTLPQPPFPVDYSALNTEPAKLEPYVPDKKTNRHSVIV
ncbi:hypothetical protein MSG28_011849 [Choristoneura fumiferana]|uniref:Uncharacterized protein n=1 Tax=Choristoneura fumiferana TaxID=7141 RepID=A0ACC0KNC4_CHOFU|nr:hypothetical protein MSG28_011849 [Choristoneura fumiferana]